MLNIKADSKNYTAKLIKIDNLRPHPEADRLQLTTVDFQTVIVGLDTKIGDLNVYFPLECKLNTDLLSKTNSYSDAELNADKTKKGFFHKSGRVKAVRLRGIASEGYLHPLKSFNEWSPVHLNDSHLNIEFDHIDDLMICRKYVPPIKISTINKVKLKGAKKESKLIDNQFRLHADTENLKRNIHNISPNDLISISYKLHGTSFSIGNVLCKKTLKWYEKILKKVGVNIVDSQYDLVVASRKVIKNAYADKKHNSFYDHDIWSTVGEELRPFIPKGVTLYGEIVGRLPTGKWIQKNYDYGHDFYGVYVYRITYTNTDGKVLEFTNKQIQTFCEANGLNTPKVFYYGYAKDLYRDIDNNDHWHESFLNKLIENYNEKNCFMCRNKVPEEGIVLRKEGDVFEAYKLKSIKFLERETKDLDNDLGDFTETDH